MIVIYIIICIIDLEGAYDRRTIFNIDNSQNTKTIKLTDEEYFHFFQKEQLGKTKSELIKLPTGNIPVYTANKEPILYIARTTKDPIFASQDEPIISFANDGDGLAGRNFVLHLEPFYINASRTAFKLIDSNILPEYVLSQIFDMKEKYGFNYAKYRQGIRLCGCPVFYHFLLPRRRALHGVQRPRNLEFY